MGSIVSSSEIGSKVLKINITKVKEKWNILQCDLLEIRYPILYIHEPLHHHKMLVSTEYDFCGAHSRNTNLRLNAG